MAHEKLRHEPPEAARGLVGIGTARFFQRTQLPDAVPDGGALAGVFRRNGLLVLSEDLRHQLRGEFPLVLPVVPRLEAGQRHIHSCGVADIFIVRPGAALARMGDAATLTGGFLRFIEAHKQQGEKRHVIAQRQTAELTIHFPDGAADAAVDRLIAVFLLLAQLLQRGGDKSKHSSAPPIEVSYGKSVNWV